ncbi:MAG: hypothetical protein KDK90_27235 [Leptospiraceae bacterium]|nr:hypothetical protein [Leptospiraceae bacterium]
MYKKHIFKYYENRKIYNTETKKLSNYCEILQSLKDGNNVQVIYNKTGDDITHHILFQILISEMKHSPEYVVKIFKILLLGDEKNLKKIQKAIDEIILENESKTL